MTTLKTPLAILQKYLDCNIATGVIRYLLPFNGIETGQVAGIKDSRGYLRVHVPQLQITYAAHRLIWLFAYGSWPYALIDHRNGVTWDNCIENLRDVSTTVNAQNMRKAMSNNKTGYLGVSYCKRNGKYDSRISIKGTIKFLGYFLTPELAHEAYLAAKREHHEGCTI